MGTHTHFQVEVMDVPHYKSGGAGNPLLNTSSLSSQKFKLQCYAANTDLVMQPKARDRASGVRTQAQSCRSARQFKMHSVWRTRGGDPA